MESVKVQALHSKERRQSFAFKDQRTEMEGATHRNGQLLFDIELYQA
jgi:hypothetical protein